MRIVIIDSRNGGTRLSVPAQAAFDVADIILHIEQDNVVRVDPQGIDWEEGTPKATLFYAQTEAESSADLAAKHLAERVGKARSEHDNQAALAKGRAVWDRMGSDD